MSATEDQLCEDTEEKLKVTEKDEDPAPREREEKSQRRRRVQFLTWCHRVSSSRRMVERPTH
jgi:hypothetical protein